MTCLLILSYNILICSAFFVVNCKCYNNEHNDTYSSNIKVSTYDVYKQMFHSIGTSFVLNKRKYNISKLAGNNLNIKLLDNVEEVTSEETHPQPEPPRPVCPEQSQETTFGTIKWPATQKGEEAKSTPLCLNANMIIMKRTCQDVWESAPECKSIQNVITNPCPSDLQYIHNKYCYTIIEKTSYPPNCPYQETIGWNEYIQLDLTKNPIWMPVKRKTETIYGEDVMRFTEPTENYYVPYEICGQSCRIYFYSGSFLDKLCQIYHNSTHIEAVNCDEQYSAVCVYHTLPQRIKKSFCSQVYPTINCKQSEYSTKSDCFCEAPNNQQVGDSVRVEFLLPYQNLLYNELDKSCHIGLEKDEDATQPIPFIWSASKSVINYSNWATNVNINFENKFGLMTSEGWILQSEQSEDCIFYKLTAPTETGKLELDVEQDLFQLTVRNHSTFLSNESGEPLVYCFSDADAQTLIYRIQDFSRNLQGNDYIYEFSRLNIPQSGPGNYWCEAFLYPDLHSIQSEIKLIKHNGAEYVVIVKLKDYEEKLSSYPLRAENLATLQNLFKNELVNIMSFFPRIFKVSEIDEDKKELTITFHLSSDTATDGDDVFNTLKSAAMAQTMFEFVDFRHVDYCPSVTSRQTSGQIITWPQTKLNEKTDPKDGFCVTKDVSVIQRTCTGNFVDGAYWSEIEENCTFYASSSQTEKLFEITYSTDVQGSEFFEVLAITEHYSSFNTLDLVLTVKFLETIAENKPNLEIFAEIMNNIMKISRPVLLSSQLNFKATDLLLLCLDKALENGDVRKYTTDNFAMTAVDIKANGIYGIFLQNCLTEYGNCELVSITDTSQLMNESFISDNGVVAAIVLSPKLYDQINKYSESNSSYVPKLIASIYYGSQLFVEQNSGKFSDYVFGILFPGFTEKFTGPLSIYYFNTNKNNYLGYNCSYWEFNDTMFSSWANEGTEDVNQAVYCEFYHVTNFGIPFILSEEYCDASQNVKENSDCLSKELLFKKSFVTYLPVCEPGEEEINREYEDVNLFTDETVNCTIYELNGDNNPLAEFCITLDAVAIPIKCFENFNREKNIFNISENCVTYPLNMSKKVLDIRGTLQEDCWNVILDIVLVFTSDYDDLSDLDILIAASAMSPAAYSKPDLQKVAGIVNNIMKTPKSTLKNAQQNFKAIDILLHNIEEAQKHADCNEWKTENFVIKCLDINLENLNIVIQNCSNDFKDCHLFPKANIIDSNESYTVENMQAMISLTENLYEQIIAYGSQNLSYFPRIIVSFYSGSQLFVELNESTLEENIFSFVFGILLPDFNEIFASAIKIYYFNNVSPQNLLQYNCSYWNYDSTSYGKWRTENTYDNKQVAMCEFYHVTHFYIPTKLLNCSQTEIFEQNHFCSLNSKSVAKLKNQKHNSKISSSKNKEEKMCISKSDQLQKYDGTFYLNNLIVNIFDKMDMFRDIFYFTTEYCLTFLGSIVATFKNKLVDDTASLDKKSRCNHSTNFICEVSNPFYVYPTCKTKFVHKQDTKKIALKLEKINTNQSNKNLNTIFAKLEHLILEYTSYDLDEYDVELIAKLLQETKSQSSHNSLKEVASILNAMMMMPTQILFKAQTKFNSTDKILYLIDTIAQTFETTLQIRKENIIILCVSKEDVSNFFGFYITKDKQIVYIINKNDEINKFNDSEFGIWVKISPELQNQIIATKTRIIFVIFYNDVYFPSPENSEVTKPIVEVLFPDLNETFKANFTITYKLTNDISKLSECSYWDHLVTAKEVLKTGSWKRETPAQINGDLVSCVFNHATHFALVTSSQNITTDLEYILTSNLTGLEKLKQVDSITYKSHASLLPVDIFLISQILGSSLTEGAVDKITSNIISNLFNVPSKVLRESQELHTATDIILHNVDTMATMLDDAFISLNNFSLIVKDLNYDNLTGVLLHGCNKSNCIIDQLNDSINISDYINDDEMSALLIFSDELITQLRNLTVDPRVIVSIYYSNVFFNEIDKERNTTMIFGVIFPGLNASLEGEISVIYNVESQINDSHQCAYWYYKADPTGNVDNATFGRWQNDTARERQGQVAICNFSHVTHFSMLLSNNDSSNDDALLRIITDIGCILSLIGITMIILTAIFFKKWRQSTGNKILINFSIAISLKIAMLYISEYVKSTSTGIGCTISGSILHYAILSECTWMLTIAILQFKRFVEVLGGPPKYILVKALTCGWVFPIIPVICVISIDPDNYMAGNAGLCYPSNLGLYLGVWLPVILIVSINCVIFIFIMYNVFHKKTEYIDNANGEILFQWRLALLLFFMLGLTWLFGFLGEINGDTTFTYVFSITASLQGFVLFLFFIVFNKSTRVLYSHYAKQWFYSKRIFKLWQTKSQEKY